MDLVWEILAAANERQQVYFRRFYGPVVQRPLGAGAIVVRAVYSVLDILERQPRVAEGTALVMTHECDIDQNNRRVFNSQILILPIIDFGIWVESEIDTLGRERLVNVGRDIVNNYVSRCFYVPRIRDDLLPFGGIIDLNQMTNTFLSLLTERSQLDCFLSRSAMTNFDRKFQEHLFRPKPTDLPDF